MLIFPNKLLSELDKNINSYFPFDMSGHSKWATTKRHKAAVDAKIDNDFVVMANEIVVDYERFSHFDQASQIKTHHNHQMFFCPQSFS